MQASFARALVMRVQREGLHRLARTRSRDTTARDRRRQNRQDYLGKVRARTSNGFMRGISKMTL